MSDIVTLTGLVATTPRHLVTTEGLSITSFRLASNQRRYDRAQEKWIDGDTNWYTVTAFRQLAMNSAGSISKGDRILVTGRLKIREWESADRAGTSIEIEAETLGHDLTWGTATFTRSLKAAEASAGFASETPAEPDRQKEADADSDSDADADAEAEETQHREDLVPASAPF